MANAKKRTLPPKGKTKPKFQHKRAKTFSEKVFIVMGILIALSMIASLIVNFIPHF